jgi:hypothetical protein
MMTTMRPSSVPARSIAWIGLFFLILHVPLLIYDLQNPAALVEADRGGARLIKVEKFLDALERGEFVQHIRTTTAHGDYFFQGIVIYLFGPYGLIATQLVLQLLATLVVYRVATRWMDSHDAALAAALLYVALPSSVYHPHVLASESIVNPLFAIAFGLILYSLNQGRRSNLAMVSAGICLSVVIATRNQYFLFPVIAVFLFYLSSARNKSALAAALAFLVVSWLPIAGSAYWSDQSDGHVSDHGLKRNLYIRFERIAEIDGFPAREFGEGHRAMTVSEFVEVVAHHPKTYLHTLGSDALNLTLNPGANTLFGRYLGWLPGESDGHFWRRVNEERGLAGILSSLASQGALLLGVMVLATAIWILIILMALVGMFRMAYESSFLLVERTLVLLTVLYSFLVPFVSGIVRWTHRSGAEFLIILLCVYGFCEIVRRRRGVRSGKNSDLAELQES